MQRQRRGVTSGHAAALVPVAIGGSDAETDVTFARRIPGWLRSEGGRGGGASSLRQKHEKDCRCLQVGGRAERSPTPIVDKVRTRRGRRKRRRRTEGRKRRRRTRTA